MENKKGLKVFFVIIVSIIFVTYLYARYIGTTGLIIKEYKIVDSEIPESFNGLKIIHFSDLHYGRTINKKEFQKIVEKINELSPDIIFFTGDLIDTDTKMNNEIFNDVKNELKNIDSNIGKYAVTGNHDYKNNFYTKILLDSDFILLNNNYDIAYNKSLTPIFIGGVANYTYKKADIKETMSYFENKTDLYKIILVHEPDYIEKMNSYDVNLVLAGHSHNGQVRLPFIGKVITPYGSKKYYDEYYKVNNTNLFISSGLGTSGYNVRLFNRPSVNLYTLSNK